ncbi:hypothetical protein BH10BAC5_BH10BAC5_09360 [soil metagenome]
MHFASQKVKPKMKNLKNSKVYLTIFTLTIALIFAGCGKSPENKVQTTNSTNISNQNYADAKELKIDVNQSIVEWLGKKVTGQHNGTVKISEGNVYVKDNKLVGGTVKVDIRTLENTDLASDPDSKKKLEGHLKSDDFFNAEKFNFITFVISSVEESNDPSKPKYIVKGNLTIRDITKGVSFPANIDINGNNVTADINADIDRTDFGLKYGSGKFFEGLGDKAISDIFNLKIKITAK